jgi:hypothetical protein
MGKVFGERKVLGGWMGAGSFLPAVAVRYLCERVCARAQVSIKGECARGLPKFNYPRAIKLTRNQNNKTVAPNGWIRKLSARGKRESSPRADVYY